MKTIGEKAFYSCSSLVSVILEDGVTSIGEQAFSYCNNMTSITIPKSVTEIAYWTIPTISSVNPLTVYVAKHDTDRVRGLIGSNLDYYTFVEPPPDTIPSCEETVNGITWIYSVTADYATIEDKDEWASYRAIPQETSGCVEIPASFHGGDYPVTGIGKNAFYDCGKITSITIPDGVTTIGADAFDGCTSLVDINIPSSVTSIGNDAFFWCDSLETVYVEAGDYARVKGMFEASGFNTSELNFWTYGMTAEVGDILWTFDVCNGNAILENGGRPVIPDDTEGALVIPSTLGGYPVTEIGEAAFYYCEGLTSVTIPSGVTSIGDGAFECCRELVSVTIPASVADIGESAFYECENLESVTIPEGVTEIRGYTFGSCFSISSVTIPSSVTAIGDSAFVYCSGLLSITIPGSVASIGAEAFYGCGITSAVLKNGVETIGNDAFEGCLDLVSITIPSSVTSIGNDAFWGCGSLETVYVDKGDTARVYAMLDGTGYPNMESLTFEEVAVKGEPATVGTVGFDANGKFVISFTGTEGATYVLKKATSLTAPVSWTTVKEYVATGSAQETDAMTTDGDAGFYKLEAKE